MRSIEGEEGLGTRLVLVIFGGMIGHSGDDINKFLWMVHIAEGEHPQDIKVCMYVLVVRILIILCMLLCVHIMYMCFGSWNLFWGAKSSLLIEVSKTSQC